jgi:hypothetical protein
MKRQMLKRLNEEGGLRRLSCPDSRERPLTFPQAAALGGGLRLPKTRLSICSHACYGARM